MIATGICAVGFVSFNSLHRVLTSVVYELLSSLVVPDAVSVIGRRGVNVKLSHSTLFNSTRFVGHWTIQYGLMRRGSIKRCSI